MYKYLGQVKTEINKLDKMYIAGKIDRDKYLERLEYLKEWANHFEHENRTSKRK